jgi:hypothetical protein
MMTPLNNDFVKSLPVSSKYYHNSCEVDPSLRPPMTDHFPIITNVSLPQEHANTPPSFNFRETDWDEFRRKLEPRLQHSPEKPIITDRTQLNEAIGNYEFHLWKSFLYPDFAAGSC